MSMQASQMRSLQGMRLNAARPAQALKASSPRMVNSRRQVSVRADGFLGSTTNLIMIASTTLFLSAARFGLAPTSNAHTGAGTKLYVKNDSGVASNDPSGFNIVDVLVGGSQGHVVGIGMILGLRAMGAL